MDTEIIYERSRKFLTKMSQDAREDMSAQVCKFMDSIGYSNSQIARRAEQNSSFISSFQNLKKKPVVDKGVDFIFDKTKMVGSTGEGVESFFSSDIDLLYTDTRDFRTRGKTSPAVPGYVLLQTTAGENIRTDPMSLTNTGLSGTKEGPFHYKGAERKGPAAASSMTTLMWEMQQDVKIDQVFGVNCTFPELLDAWCKRPRQYGWPSTATVEKVATLPSNVVQVGQKGSENSDDQWRISFTEAEMFLVSTFNSTQMKEYILLRNIAKNILKPPCDDVTSYIIKNIAFWHFESKDYDTFTEDQLLERLQEALELLKESIQKRELPNYMIPQRNLFTGRLETEDQVSNLIQKITDTQATLPEHFEAILQTSDEEVVQIFSKKKSELKEMPDGDESVTEKANKNMQLFNQHFPGLQDLQAILHSHDQEVKNKSELPDTEDNESVMKTATENMQLLQEHFKKLMDSHANQQPSDEESGPSFLKSESDLSNNEGSENVTENAEIMQQFKEHFNRLKDFQALLKSPNDEVASMVLKSQSELLNAEGNESVRQAAIASMQILQNFNLSEQQISQATGQSPTDDEEPTLLENKSELSNTAGDENVTQPDTDSVQTLEDFQRLFGFTVMGQSPVNNDESTLVSNTDSKESATEEALQHVTAQDSKAVGNSDDKEEPTLSKNNSEQSNIEDNESATEEALQNVSARKIPKLS